MRKTTLTKLTLFAAAALLFAGGCVEQESDKPTESDRKAIEKNILKTAPKPEHALNADFEGNLTYLGLDVSTDVVKPGVSFKLTHYWQVKKPIPGWKIFTHLNNEDHRAFVNADHKPVGGRYAAAYWRAGEIIRDEHSVSLPKNWSHNSVKVYVGLWKGAKRMRPTGPQDAQNRLLAATLKVDTTGVPKPTPPQRLVAAQSKKPVVVDGKLDDAVWKVAKPTGKFVNTMTGAASPLETTAQVAWDEKFLYVAFSNKDQDVWSNLTKRDASLWTQEAVEIFIDADGDGKDYVELQVNPNGAIFDSFLPRYRANQNDWNSGMIAKVVVDGTVNQRSDVDKGWTVEIAIPWKDVVGRSKAAVKLPPALGQSFRVNFFRLDKPKSGPQLAASWSAPLVGDFHKLDRFGELVFGDAEGSAPAPATAASPAAQPATAAAPTSGTQRVMKMAVPIGQALKAIEGQPLVRRASPQAGAPSKK
ncbi:MAG: carbohydrate-binding family 9-like protein [Deltaproteobacteria bacterium]|nr:carbohydrate-binding family 9-like protein [Deltaproteobacteria bacterium]